MLIPLRSDTRMDHFPWVTIFLISLNVFVFVFIGPPWGKDSLNTQYFILSHQDGLHPIQWFLSTFAHADIIHLVSNMIFLWAFGFIIEGDVGHIRYIAIYVVSILAIGIIEQIIFYNHKSSSLGASSVIYSLMLIAVIWLPQNEIECIYLIWYRPGYIEIKIQWFAALYFGLDLFNSFFSLYGSSFLHIIGGFVGIIIGTIFLVKKWVDPEGWDFYSLYFKSKNNDKKQTTSNKKAFQLNYESVPKINRAIQIKDIEEAVNLYKKNPDIQNNPNFNHLGFFKLLFEKGEFKTLIELSEFVITNLQSDYSSIQLLAAKAVKISLKNEQLMLEILQRIDPKLLSYSDKKAYQELMNNKNKKNDPENPFSLEEI